MSGNQIYEMQLGNLCVVYHQSYFRFVIVLQLQLQLRKYLKVLSESTKAH